MIFINIGSNDIGSAGPEAYKISRLINNYNIIMNQIKERLPRCEVYVMAYYPINAEADFGLNQVMKDMVFATRSNATIKKANKAIEELARKHGFSYIDVNDGLADDKGNLKEVFSIEGLHLKPNAYVLILENMKKYLLRR
jgi:lysophospholipase L1-like esterase